MGKKIKRVAIFIAIYILVFWVGFRAGEIINRIKKAEQIVINPATEAVPAQGKAVVYYVVEQTHDNNPRIIFDESTNDSVIMKFLGNEKLKPLLKMRDLQIYTEEGDRIY